MFERFTEPSIKVIMCAQEESRRLGHNFVGSEQILLGLIREGRGVASRRLAEAGVTIDRARVEVEKIIGRGNGNVAIEIPFTPRAKRVLELSWKEASRLNDDRIGTEHLLLGLLLEGEGVAARVLEILKVDRNKLRQNVLGSIGRQECDLPETPVVPLEATSANAGAEFSWYTPEAVVVVQRAWGIAETFGAELISEEHLCLALLRDSTLVQVALGATNLDLAELRRHLLGKLTTSKGIPAESRKFTPDARKVLERAWHLAVKHKLGWVTSETLFIGAMHDPEGALCQALRAVNVDLDALVKAVVESIDKSKVGADKLDEASMPQSSIPHNPTPLLSQKTMAGIAFIALVLLALTAQNVYLADPALYVVFSTILLAVCFLLVGIFLLRKAFQP